MLGIALALLGNASVVNKDASSLAKDDELFTEAAQAVVNS